MIKDKKCKGQGKALGYGCGKVIDVRERVYGLGKSCGCYSKWLTTTDAGAEILSKSIAKVQRARLSYENEKEQHIYQSKLKLAKNNTKLVVHRYVRERDKYKPCISCGVHWNSEFQCGHFYKAELFETLKYNLDNLNGQCKGCNLHKDGNVQNYSIELPKRIGQARYDALVKLAEVDKHYTNVKYWTLEKLKEVRDNINQKTKNK